MQDREDSSRTAAAPERQRGYSLEVTGKDIAQLEAARHVIPQGTPINIAFLGNENHEQRINAARVIRACGFEPVPIISSRRLRSEEDLDDLLGALIRGAAPSRFLFVGGDPAKPAGPFTDSLVLLESGVLRRHAIRHVGIAGYPEGHPKIDSETLWKSLKWKIAFLEAEGCSVEITTQFGFDAEAVLRWIRELRSAGIGCPVRIGVPGPADAGRLLRFARQFGAASSARVVRRYGFSLVNLLQRVGPERFLDRLVPEIAGGSLGTVLFHLYPFGGIAEAVDWMSRYLAGRDLPQGILPES